MIFQQIFPFNMGVIVDINSARDNFPIKTNSKFHDTFPNSYLVYFETLLLIALALTVYSFLFSLVNH